VVRFQNGRSNGVASAPSRAERRAEARRLDILRAASRVFRERGFAGAGMREIAAAADLSPANLYHYFGGKHEILYFCQDRSLDRMLGAVGGARRSEERLVDRLRGVIEAHALCLLDKLEGSAAHLELESLPEKLREPILAKRDRYEREIRRLVTEGVDRGEFAPCDPKLVTRAILGAVNWSARWFRRDGADSPEQVASGLADFLVRGLVFPSSPSRRRPSRSKARRRS